MTCSKSDIKTLTVSSTGAPTVKEPWRSKQQQRATIERRQSTFESVTDDVIKDLSLDSNFFTENPLCPVPSVTIEDLTIGSQLGQGVFGSVYEVLSLRLDSHFGSSQCSFSDHDLEQTEQNVPPTTKSAATSSKAFVKTNSTQDPNNHSSYVVKLLRPDVREGIRSDAIIDLACEAQYLERLSHPNIIRLRATVGQSGFSSFMLVLDRLNQTLSAKLNDWKQALLKQERRQSDFGLTRTFLRRKSQAHWHQQEESKRVLFQERLLAVTHVARALRHLHSKGLLFRDIKPENVGLDDHSGQWKLFDFGLCKELKSKDLVQPPDGYLTSGAVGSRRYMAPEVAQELPYGFAADSFSFAILFWEVFALELPFDTLDKTKHYDQVVLHGKRPHSIHRTLPNLLHSLMEQCWSGYASERPRFDNICLLLDNELAKLPLEPEEITTTRSSIIQFQQVRRLLSRLPVTKWHRNDELESDDFSI